MDGKWTKPAATGAGPCFSVTRRSLLKTGLGAGAAGLLMPLAAPRVWAKSYQMPSIESA